MMALAVLVCDGQDTLLFSLNVLAKVFRPHGQILSSVMSHFLPNRTTYDKIQ